jgi:tripartite-type tricarboxylate transporter receptor subunit TctC
LQEIRVPWEAPFGQYTDEPFVFAVHPAVPARTLGELVALGKREPGKLSYGSSGMGGLAHLGKEFFLDAAGIRITNVPYRGTGPALSDLLAGNVQILTRGTATLLPFVKSGKLRALAIAHFHDHDPRRDRALADLHQAHRHQAGVAGTTRPWPSTRRRR